MAVICSYLLFGLVSRAKERGVFGQWVMQAFARKQYHGVFASSSWAPNVAF